MLEFNICENDNSKNTYNLAIILNKGNNEEIETLIDTGASLPAWVDGIDSFLAYFPDSKYADTEAIISGFGQKAEIAPVYVIPTFELSDGNDKIVYNNLYIAVVKRDYSFSMVISFTMLNKMNISYSYYKNYNGKTTILKPPILRIKYIKSKYTVGVKRYSVANKVYKKDLNKFKAAYIINTIYIFTT